MEQNKHEREITRKVYFMNNYGTIHDPIKQNKTTQNLHGTNNAHVNMHIQKSKPNET